jgi:hypothetical protein
VGPFGIEGETRRTYKALADKLENALKKWVGEDVYPRAHYAEASKNLNKWGSKLGQALTGRQDIEYLGPDAPEQFQGKVVRKLFSSSSTVKEGIELLGKDEMGQLTDRYVSNVFRRKDSAAAVKWLEENQWIKEFPESNRKAIDYVQALGERERNAETLKKVRKLAAGIAVGAAVGEGYRLIK